MSRDKEEKIFIKEVQDFLLDDDNGKEPSRAVIENRPIDTVWVDELLGIVYDFIYSAGYVYGEDC